MGRKTGVTDGSTTSEKKSKRRGTKAALVAGAVGCTVAATAAYRRRNAHRHLGNAAGPTATEYPRFATTPTDTPPTDGAGPEAEPGDTQPL